MPAVRSRRAPGRRGKTAPLPPPPPRRYSRLEAIHQAHQSGVGLAPNTPAAKSILAGALLFTGVATALAAFLGAQLYDVRLAAGAAVDAAATAAGMRVQQIEVEGLDGARAEEVRGIALPDGRASMLAADPRDVKARVESLDFVARAQVQRLWPGTVRIDVVRREAMARWQENGQITLVDAAGERLHAGGGDRGEGLPLLVGAGAGPAAQPLLVALEDLPGVRSRVEALVRVGDRRFDLRLSGGITVQLPEMRPTAALVELESLHVRHRLLDRAVRRIDLRVPHLLALTPAPPTPIHVGA
jgi:cell division protein FtsQ